MKNLTIVIFLMFLVGCSSVKEGEVIQKRHEPSRTWVSVTPIVKSNGKTTTTTMIPYVYYDSEDYVITIEGLNKKGELETRKIY